MQLLIWCTMCGTGWKSSLEHRQKLLGTERRLTSKGCRLNDALSPARTITAMVATPAGLTMRQTAPLRHGAGRGSAPREPPTIRYGTAGLPYRLRLSRLVGAPGTQSIQTHRPSSKKANESSCGSKRDTACDAGAPMSERRAPSNRSRDRSPTKKKSEELRPAPSSPSKNRATPREVRSDQMVNWRSASPDKRPENQKSPSPTRRTYEDWTRRASALDRLRHGAAELNHASHLLQAVSNGATVHRASNLLHSNFRPISNGADHGRYAF